MASPQEWHDLTQKMRDRMSPIDLRNLEYAVLAEIESKSDIQFHPDERAMVTVVACCRLAGLVPISVEPGVETTQMASLFKSFWLRKGRSPTLGEARAIVSMIDPSLLPPQGLLIESQLNERSN